MPTMTRTNKKAQRIAFNILGTPANMKKQKSKTIKDVPEVKTDAKYDEMMRITSR